MRASLDRAQKLVGDPSLLHCLTGFDTVSSRAFSPFAHAQKPILPNSIIIKRTSDATLLLLYHQYWARLLADPYFLITVYLVWKVRATFFADRVIDLDAFFDFVHERLTIACFL